MLNQNPARRGGIESVVAAGSSRANLDLILKPKGMSLGTLSARNTTKYLRRASGGMVSADLEKLRQQLVSAQSVTHDRLEELMHQCKELPLTDHQKIAFYLTRCNSDGFREDELVRFLLDQMVTYVLGKEEYKEIKAEDVRRVVLAAKETFQQTEESGEAGELLLYVLLESRGIIQLYSKMDLKTSKGMPFHGYDAIHLEAGESAVLHFGHAKTYASFSDGLASAVSDVERFRSNSPQRERELRLVSKNLDKVKFGDSTEYIRKLINPYSKHKEEYAEADSIFVGSEFPFTKEGIAKGSEFDRLMLDRYQEVASGIGESVRSAVQKREGIGELTLLFLILPVTDVKTFRERFAKELGR